MLPNHDICRGGREGGGREEGGGRMEVRGMIKEKSIVQNVPEWIIPVS